MWYTECFRFFAFWGVRLHFLLPLHLQDASWIENSNRSSETQHECSMKTDVPWVKWTEHSSIWSLREMQMSEKIPAVLNHWDFWLFITVTWPKISRLTELMWCNLQFDNTLCSLEGNIYSTMSLFLIPFPHPPCNFVFVNTLTISKIHNLLSEFELIFDGLYFLSRLYLFLISMFQNVGNPPLSQGVCICKDSVWKDECFI